MVDLKKYKFDGWGLSKEAFLELEKIIQNEKIESAIEFGSGQSTHFLSDMGLEFLSFDDDLSYSAKLNGVIIRDLISLDGPTFDKVINNEIDYIDICGNYPKVQNKSTSQKNCFYKLEKNDLKKKYQLVILDGPNGNGRSIAFNVIKNYLQFPSYILIDDYNHYPFIEHFNKTFTNNELSFEHKERNSNVFRIYKILG